MLTTLLESRPHKAGDRRGTAASIAVHAAIIFTAVYANAAGAPVKDKPVNPPAIHWVATPPPSTMSTPLPTRPSPSPPAVPAVAFVTVPIVIPTFIPTINVPSPSVAPSDFVRSPAANPGASDPSAAVSSPGGGKRPYEISEVEFPVAVIGNIVPEYPSTLRAAGVEGRVKAQFIVDEAGRAEAASIRIISGNVAFAESIRRALLRMTFRPARIGGRSVAQLVQQEFVFRLDR